MAIVRVNSSAVYNGGSGASISSPATSLTAGNLIVAQVRISSTTGSSTVADTAGNTWRLVARYAPFGTTSTVEVWYALDCLGHATNVVTTTYNAASAFRSLLTVQYSGLALVGPQESVGEGASTGTTATATPIWTSVANSVIVGCCGIDATGSVWTPHSGFTNVVQDSDAVQMLQDNIVSATQANLAVTGATAGGGAQRRINVVTFHETVGGGGGGTEHSATFVG